MHTTELQMLHRIGISLVHSSDEPIDQHLPVPMISTLNEMPRLLPEASASVAELEGPEEVVGLLEVRSHGEHLVDEVLHADDSIFAQRALDDGVLREWDTAAVDFAKPSLVDELTNALEVGVATQRQTQ